MGTQLQSRLVAILLMVDGEKGLEASVIFSVCAQVTVPYPEIWNQLNQFLIHRTGKPRARSVVKVPAEPDVVQ